MVDAFLQPASPLASKFWRLRDDWIEGLAPVLFGIVHHQINEDGHEKGEDRGAVADLSAVDATVPGRATMDELIAQYVKPIENEAEYALGISALDCLRESTRGGLEAFLPIVESSDPVVVLPERIEDVAVVHQQPHRS